MSKRARSHSIKLEPITSPNHKGGVALSPKKRRKRKSAIRGRQKIRKSLALGGMLDSQIDSQQWLNGVTASPTPSIQLGTREKSPGGDADSESAGSEVDVEPDSETEGDSDKENADLTVEAAPALVKDPYAHALKTVHLLLEQLRTTFQDEQLRAATLEITRADSHQQIDRLQFEQALSYDRERAMEEELRVARGELQALRDIVASVTVKLTQGQAGGHSLS